MLSAVNGFRRIAKVGAVQLQRSLALRAYSEVPPSPRRYTRRNDGQMPSRPTSIDQTPRRSIPRRDFDNEDNQDDRPTWSNEVLSSTLKRGQQIKAKVIFFGPLGASVEINDTPTRGLILQREINSFRARRDGEDVVVGEELVAYVEKIRDDGKVNVGLKPMGLPRIQFNAELVLAALEGSPTGRIPVGDSSEADAINDYFQGMSKAEFKSAVGLLYSQGKAKPGPESTQLLSEAEQAATMAKKKTASTASAKFNQLTERQKRTVFVGNLPPASTADELSSTLVSWLGKDPTSVIAVRDQTIPRGFCWVELRDADCVEQLVSMSQQEGQGKKGRLFKGRVLRLDRAIPKTESTAAPTASVPSPIRTVRPAAVAIEDDSENVDDYDDVGEEEEEEVAQPPPKRASVKAPAITTNKAKGTDIDDFLNTGSNDDSEPLINELASQRRERRESRPPLSPLSVDDAARRDWRLTPTNVEDGEGGQRSRDRGIKPAAKLFVGNLAYKTDASDLQQHIQNILNRDSQNGGMTLTVSAVRIMEEAGTGRRRGFGYVDIVRRGRDENENDDEEEGGDGEEESVLDRAKRLLDGSQIDDRSIRIDSAESSNRQGPSFNGGGDRRSGGGGGRGGGGGGGGSYGRDRPSGSRSSFGSDRLPRREGGGGGSWGERRGSGEGRSSDRTRSAR